MCRVRRNELLYSAAWSVPPGVGRYSGICMILHAQAEEHSAERTKIEFVEVS